MDVVRADQTFWFYSSIFDGPGLASAGGDFNADGQWFGRRKYRQQTGVFSMFGWMFGGRQSFSSDAGRSSSAGNQTVVTLRAAGSSFAVGCA
jgi:hypothetical protein